MQSKTTLEGIQNSPESEIDEIKITIERAKEYVGLRDDLLKLTSNRAFKKLFLEGYLKNEPVRLTCMLGNPALKDSRDDIILDLQGISAFKAYCDEVLRQGDMAAASIKEYEMALDEAYAEAYEESGE